MIKWKLATLKAEAYAMGDPVTLGDIAQATGMAETTVQRIYANKAKRADLATIGALLVYFAALLGRSLSVNDLLEWRAE